MIEGQSYWNTEALRAEAQSVHWLTKALPLCFLLRMVQPVLRAAHHPGLAVPSASSGSQYQSVTDALLRIFMDNVHTTPTKE